MRYLLVEECRMQAAVSSPFPTSKFGREARGQAFSSILYNVPSVSQSSGLIPTDPDIKWIKGISVTIELAPKTEL